jgi:hypothetical protein
MGPGPVGEAILFVLSLAAAIIVGTGVLAFLARCVLVVVQDTGMGHDKVTWPSEPFQDWLGHAVLFFELLGIWVMPAALAARLLRETWLPDAGALRVLLLAGPGLWLFFPIGLLSSLSAQSRWTPFRWTIFVCFLRIAPAALIFYFLTILLLGGAAALWYYALFGGRGVLLPVAAGVSGAVVLIYARLLGRVAWLIQRLPSTRRTPLRPKDDKPAPPKGRQPAKPRGKKKRKPASEVQDPWAVPEEEKARRKLKRFPWAEEEPPATKKKSGLDIPSAEEIEGYGIAAGEPAAEKPPEKPRSRLAMSPEEYEPIDVQGTSDPEPQWQAEPQSELFAAQVRQRLAERERVELPPPPPPFFSGVYTFPFYPLCLPHWIALSVAFLIEGGIVYMMIEFGHQLFGW